MSFPHRAFTGGAGVDETKAYVPSNAVVAVESAWVCASAAATKLKIPPALCATSRVLTASHWSKVQGRRVTGFTNGEEAAVHLTEVVPFLVEDELKRLGGLYEKAADWATPCRGNIAKSPAEPMVRRLSAGAEWIRTSSTRAL